MVEQPQIGMRKHNPMFIRSLDTLLIHNTPTRRSKILDPTPKRTMDVIREREKRITRTRNPTQRLCMFLLLFLRKRSRYTLKLTLPLVFLTTLEYLTANE